MKISLFFCMLFLLLPFAAWGQAPASSTPPGTAGVAPGAPAPHAKMSVMYHREMGKWWQNSEIAKKLQLSDGQVSQLDQIFYDHRMKLIDYGAQTEKLDLKLQTLLDADVPNEGQIGSQVDLVLASKGKLEREYTMMNLDLRKVLSLEQWRQLKSMHGGGGDKMFFHNFPASGMGVSTMPLPPGAPLPPLPPMPVDPDEMF